MNKWKIYEAIIIPISILMAILTVGVFVGIYLIVENMSVIPI